MSFLECIFKLAFLEKGVMFYPYIVSNNEPSSFRTLQLLLGKVSRGNFGHRVFSVT